MCIPQLLTSVTRKISKDVATLRTLILAVRKYPRALPHWGLGICFAHRGSLQRTGQPVSVHSPVSARDTPRRGLFALWTTSILLARARDIQPRCKVRGIPKGQSVICVLLAASSCCEKQRTAVPVIIAGEKKKLDSQTGEDLTLKRHYSPSFHRSRLFT